MRRNRPPYARVAARVVGAIGLLVCAAVPAADATESPELVAAKGRAELAKAEAEYAKAQADLFKARVGELGGDQVPKGTVEAKGLNVEGQTRAYATIADAAGRIAEAIKTHVCTGSPVKCSSVVLASDAELQLLLRYRAFRPTSDLLVSRASALAEDVRKFTAPAECSGANVASTALTGAPPLAVVSTALGVLGLFKTDRTYEGSTVGVDAFALTTLLLRELKKKDIAVVYLPTRIDYATPKLPADWHAADAPNVLKKYDALLAKSALLTSAADGYVKRRELVSKSPAVKAEPCKSAWSAAVTVGDQNEASARALAAAIQDQLTVLAKVDDTTGRSALLNYVVAEQLDATLDKAHYLTTKVIAAGATVHTKRNVFSTRLYVGGGSVVSYLLTNSDGEPEAFDTLAARGTFEEIR